MYKANTTQLESFKVEYDYLKSKMNLGKELVWLTKDDCINLGPSIEETLEIVRGALVAHGKKEYEMPAKIGLHPFEDVFIHSMPGYVPDSLACGAKWIACFPRNPREFGFPQTTGLLTMNEIQTGLPIAIMDCTHITAMRTPAVTALAAEALHPNAKAFGMFGCGVQGVNHVRYIGKALKKLEKIYIYDIHEDMMDALIESVKDEVSIPIIKAKSAEELVKNCDAMSSATIIIRDPLKVVKKEWIRKGQTIIPCDMNTFWDPEICKIADKYLVDSIHEHELFDSMGYFPDGMADISGETGEVIAGLHPGRTSEDEIIVCSNIGMAVTDVVMGQAILKRALESGAGVRMPL